MRRYNATTNVWTSLANIPVGSEAPPGTFYNGKIYVVDGGGANLMRIYNIFTNVWSVGSARPGPSSGGAAAGAYNGNIYIVGGAAPSSILSIYNITTSTWSVGPAAPSPYYFGGYTQIGRFLYLIGSFTSSSSSNSTVSMRLDMATNTWSTGPAWTPARADFALAAAGTQLFAIGGDSNGGSFFGIRPRRWMSWIPAPGRTGPGCLPPTICPRRVRLIRPVSSAPDGWAGRSGAQAVYLHPAALSTSMNTSSARRRRRRRKLLHQRRFDDPLTGPEWRPRSGGTVTVVLGLQNIGTPGLCTTAGLTGTLQASGGVTNPMPSSRNYGVMCAGDPAVSRSFSFTISPSLACGDIVTASLVMTDGATNYETLTYNFRTGTQLGLSENFDSVVAPAVPAGWLQINAQGGAPLWVTSTTNPDTAPNAGFVDDPAVVSDKRLDTPHVVIPSASAQLSFRNYHDLEVPTTAVCWKLNPQISMAERLPT